MSKNATIADSNFYFVFQQVVVVASFLWLWRENAETEGLKKWKRF